mmetsp:Transcript_102607/g.313781  ORF Transcript_102607/g.313781 Transcript_102607/m.313781 type:complete len:227 (-) Transcript_102607:1588-2268(-)
MIKYTSFTVAAGVTCGGQPSTKGSLPSLGRCNSGSNKSTRVSGEPPDGSISVITLSTFFRDMLATNTPSPSSNGRTTAKKSTRGCRLRSSCMSYNLVCTHRQSCTTLSFFMMLNAGAFAWSVNVRAGMPPRLRPAKFLSKNGSSNLLATKIAIRVAAQIGMPSLGNARTSNTVIAMAKARQTAAQNAAAPTIAKRAKKAPRTSSPGTLPASSAIIVSTSQAGKNVA